MEYSLVCFTFRYITVLLDDRRLGNAMFSYASLVGIAARNNMTAVLPRHNIIRDFFLGNMTIGDKHTMNLVREYEEYGRRSSAYDIKTEYLWQYYPYEVELRGYFQSWKYFQNVEDELRTSHFVFDKYYRRKAENFFRKKVPEEYQDLSVVRIGVHIRRSDMLNEEKSNFGYTVADKTYVEGAMKYFREKYPKLIFIVVSENHDWFKEEIGDSEDFNDVVFSKESKAAVDLAILSMCNHTIMTVGSFGWWGAWLANGTTIYYNRWPKPFSTLDYHTDKEQYFPPHWIPMPKNV